MPASSFWRLRAAVFEVLQLVLVSVKAMERRTLLSSRQWGVVITVSRVQRPLDRGNAAVCRLLVSYWTLDYL